MTVAITTPLRGVPVALALTDSLGGCEVLKASNPKRSENAFSMYVSNPPVITPKAITDLWSIVPKGFQHSERTPQRYEFSTKLQHLLHKNFTFTRLVN
jgi:hypothetical protein